MISQNQISLYVCQCAFVGYGERPTQAERIDFVVVSRAKSNE